MSQIDVSLSFLFDWGIWMDVSLICKQKCGI